MSLVVDIADAVAAELNAAAAGTFSETFVAERRVMPVYELREMDSLKVTVVPKSVEIVGSTRAACQCDTTVDVGVQRKILTNNMDAEVASLGSLVDQIADYLRRRPLSHLSGAFWVRVSNNPVYAVDHLMEHRVFTSVLTLTYRSMR